MGLSNTKPTGKNYISIYQKKVGDDVVGAEFWLTHEGGQDRRKAKNPQTGEEKEYIGSWFDTLSGMVKSIEVDDTNQYGTSLKVTITDDKDYVLDLKLKTVFGRSLANKVPALELGDVVSLKAYDFEAKVDGGGTRRQVGVSVKRGDDKIDDYFFDKTTKKTLHGMPAFPSDFSNLSNAKKDKYRAEVEEFLTDFINKQFGGQEAVEEEQSNFKGDAISPEDIPF